MSSYTNKTFIVFLDLPKEIEESIDSVRKKYSIKNTKKWRAHITFKQDEDFIIDETKLAQIVIDFFKDIPSIKLKLLGPKINYFNNGSWNIFIALSDNTFLKQKIKEFSRIAEQYVDLNSNRALSSTKWEQSDDFFVHISLKGGLEKEEGEKIFNQVNNENFEIEFPVVINCESITLANWEIDHWHKIINIPLK